jgi:HSP20 family molecular chaperone IbpA
MWFNQYINLKDFDLKVDWQWGDYKEFYDNNSIIEEKDGNLIVKFKIPGYGKDDVEIYYDISEDPAVIVEGKDKKFKYTRFIDIPVDFENAIAVVEKGMVIITLKKKEGIRKNIKIL